MNRTTHLLVCAICAALWVSPGLAQEGTNPSTSAPEADAVEIVRYEDEYSHASLVPARLDGKPGLAVVFKGTDDLHYYARAETVPAAGLQLKVEATSDSVKFGAALFPAWEIFVDLTGQEVEVYAGDFTVFIPIREESVAGPAGKARVTVQIAGLACTSKICLAPFEKTLSTTIDLSETDTWTQISLGSREKVSADAKSDADAPSELRRSTVLPYGTGIYYLLAIAAGISINIMPCVLPVLPLILVRLVDQSLHSARRRITSGLAFCGGVILFFAAFAALSAVIHVTTGAVLDLNGLFRYPAAVVVLFLAIVFFALVMLDVVTLTLPSSVAGRHSAASGLIGSAGMGFFAGILSTPCSGALLGFVLVWAQTQPLLVSSTAIVLMGVGMALPYGVIVSVPSLIDRLPRPGYWMEIFKKATGFLLFFIAAKLTLAALPKERLLSLLTYGIIFSFCVWMWGKWVGFSTPAPRRWTIRAVALLIAVAAGWWLLPARAQPAETAIKWQPYDAGQVRQAVAQGRPVLLKFTADWCTNCKIVERRVYHDAQVTSLIREKNVLAIKADTTLIDYPATADLKQVYGEVGNVPVSIVLLPDGTQEKLRGIFDKEQLIGILKRSPETGEQNGKREVTPNVAE